MSEAQSTRAPSEEFFSVQMPPVGQLVVSTFATARAKYPGLPERWIKISARIQSRIPDSLAMVSAQRLGELDMVCRSLEDELKQAPAQDGEMDFRFHYLMMFAELWVGSAYAIFFAMKERNQLPKDAALAEDLRLLRVQMEKHQIASDRSLAAPLPLSTGRNDPGGAPERLIVYDKSDPQRAHIARSAISVRMSPMWEVIEAKTLTSRWLERRELADRVLATLEN